MSYFLVNVGSSRTPNVYAKISPEDAELVLKYKWSITRGPDRAGPFYVRAVDRTVKPPKQIKLQRLLLNAPEGMHVDHINGEPLDNRRENLRIATPQQNQANSRKHIKRQSEFKGVTRVKNSARWRAYICIDRRQTHLGMFDTEIEAARAYDAKASQVWGEYAHLNLS